MCARSAGSLRIARGRSETPRDRPPHRHQARLGTTRSDREGHCQARSVSRVRHGRASDACVDESRSRQGPIRARSAECRVRGQPDAGGRLRRRPRSSRRTGGTGSRPSSSSSCRSSVTRASTTRRCTRSSSTTRGGFCRSCRRRPDQCSSPRLRIASVLSIRRRCDPMASIQLRDPSRRRGIRSSSARTPGRRHKCLSQGSPASSAASSSAWSRRYRRPSDRPSG